MRKTHVDGTKSYVAGTGGWHECDRCGWDYRTTELKKDGETGHLVCPKCWDPKHPLSNRR